MKTLVDADGACGFIVWRDSASEPTCEQDAAFEVVSAINGRVFYACAEHTDRVRTRCAGQVAEVRELPARG